jgi:hypothetical protein
LTADYFAIAVGTPNGEDVIKASGVKYVTCRRDTSA